MTNGVQLYGERQGKRSRAGALGVTEGVAARLAAG